MGKQKKARSGGVNRMSMADPIHGLIYFYRDKPSHRLALDVMNSKAFQRLRRVRQMGLAEFVFPGAVHTRFAHSLGSAHLMTTAVEQLAMTKEGHQILNSTYPGTDITIEQLLILGILIHDIGHPPLSHTLEDVLNLDGKHLSHDNYWNRKILTEDNELLRIWDKHDKNLPEAVLNFMGDGATKHFMASLVSSQIDMDRLDYLQRDSHFLGVKYGRIEADRIISNLCIAQSPMGQPVVAVREEATPAVEHYLFGRHQAYKMAMHPLDKASEALLQVLLKRFKDVRDEGKRSIGEPAETLYQLMVDGTSLSSTDYLSMDDCYLWQAINVWSRESRDAQLKELAERMLRHDLLKFVDIEKYGIQENIHNVEFLDDAMRTHYERRGLSYDYGFATTQTQPKPLYTSAPSREPIWIRSNRGRVVDIKEISTMPLDGTSRRGYRNLVFLWDTKARDYFIQLLEKHYPRMKEEAEDNELEGIDAEENSLI